MDEVQKKRAQVSGVRQAIGRLEAGIRELPEDAGPEVLEAYQSALTAQRAKLAGLEAEVQAAEAEVSRVQAEEAAREAHNLGELYTSSRGNISGLHPDVRRRVLAERERRGLGRLLWKR